MQAVFNNGSSHDDRDILISIGKGYIEFFYNDQFNRQRQWVSEETERRIESGEEPLDDDEKRINNFYWFSLSEWERDKTERKDRGDNWHTHMREKNWFTPEMAEYLNMASQDPKNYI